MSAIEVLKAEERVNSGKGNSRALRRASKVPCIVYGDNKEPASVSIFEKEILKHCIHAGFYSTVFELEISGNRKLAVLPKVVQFHPVTGLPLHVDFQRVNKNVAIRLHVPLEFVNEDKSPALKLGGLLNVVYHTIEVFCSPLTIPEKFEIDLTGAQMGQNFTASMLKLPEGCRFYHTVHEDSVLANIVQPQREEEIEPAAEVAGATPVATES